MHEHIGKKLPDIPMQHKGRYHGQVIFTFGVDIHRKAIHQDIDDYEFQGDIRIRVIPESPVDDALFIHRI